MRSRWKGRWWRRSTVSSAALRPGAAPPARGTAEAAFVLRDNRRNSTAIERAYREAIRAARAEIVIANAYFFPGRGFLRELRHAARRGVKVRLILQGEPDMPVAMKAARSLYRELMRDGVEIHEYRARPFHGKVALVDGQWATVGSSNLDPLSLSLNLEANLLVRDHGFNRQLHARMQRLWREDCDAVTDAMPAPARPWWLPSWLLYHVLRRFPDWAGLLPAHRPRVVALPAGAGGRRPAQVRRQGDRTGRDDAGRQARRVNGRNRNA